LEIIAYNILIIVIANEVKQSQGIAMVVFNNLAMTEKKDSRKLKCTSVKGTGYEAPGSFYGRAVGRDYERKYR
jgi:hypothetical protein